MSVNELTLMTLSFAITLGRVRRHRLRETWWVGVGSGWRWYELVENKDTRAHGGERDELYAPRTCTARVSNVANVKQRCNGATTRSAGRVRKALPRGSPNEARALDPNTWRACWPRERTHDRCRHPGWPADGQHGDPVGPNVEVARRKTTYQTTESGLADSPHVQTGCSP